MALPRPSLTTEQALQKLRHYAAYQERSHAEVRNKMWQLGVSAKDHDSIVSTLIEENYLNEERFAKLFAGGKFRQKQWGRVKIKQALQQKQISDYCIRKGLDEIEEEDYQRIARQLAAKKWNSVKGEGVNLFVKMSKTRDFLLRKGYESLLINTVIAELKATHSAS